MSGKRVAKNVAPNTTDTAPVPREVQAELIEAARGWYEGLGLSHDGIDLGECLEYKVMENMIVTIRNNERQQEGGGDEPAT